MRFKKIASIVLCIALMLTTFAGMDLSVFASDTESDERDVYYSDLFYGYSYYLENSPILASYVENSSNVFDKVYYEFADSGTYNWAFAKATIDLAASPTDLVRMISDAAGLTNYTYENMLDNANKEFAKHILGGLEEADTAGMLSKCMEPVKKVAEIYDKCVKDEELIIMDDISALGELAQQLIASGEVNNISAAKIGELNALVVENKNKITEMMGKTASIIEIWSVLATALAMENVRIELVEDIYNNAPNGMLRDGMYRLYTQLQNNFVDYFWDNYLGKELFGKLSDKVLGNFAGGNVAAAGVVLNIMSVVSTVVFEIFDIPELDDLLTQNALRHYVTDLYSALSSKVTVFSQGINCTAPIQYIEMLNALVAATRAATEASEKIALDSNKETLATFKRLYYEIDVASAVMNQAVDTVKQTPEDELIKYNYSGNIDITKPTNLSGGSNVIEENTIYCPWDGLNIGIRVINDGRLTILEGAPVKINGIYCGTRITNYGELIVTGSITINVAAFYNYGTVKMGDNLDMGYNARFDCYGNSVTHIGGNIIVGYNGGVVNVTKDATLYLGGNYEYSGNRYYTRSLGGTVILNGNGLQKMKCVNFNKLIIENTSPEGVSLTTSSINTYFNHNGNIFTATNDCTFVDYDGDGVKDNEDSEPLVGNPCVITVTTENTEYGTVSTDNIETIGGTEHTVIAEPTYKYEFVKWVNSSGASVSTSAEYSFVAKADDTLTAVFQKRSQPITVSVSGGTINAPSSAAIESTVNVSVTEDDGYVYTEGSLCYNGTAIENGSFVMPDEPVTLTAEFIRNENYFALKEKIEEAKAYTYEDYSASTFTDLQEAIYNAECELFNNVSAETANEHIAALNSAESNLTGKFITEIRATYIPELYLGVENLIYNTEITVYYDNGTYETTSAYTVDNFDCNTLGEQTVKFTYGIAFTEATITVQKRQISHVTADTIPGQIFVDNNTYFEPEINLTYPQTSETLVLGTDYNVTYSNNNLIGTATATVTGLGDYEGSIDLSFTIYCDHSEGYSAYGYCSECNGYEEPQTDSDGYYLISNPGNLFWFAETVNSGNNYINGRLMCDLEVSEYEFIKIGTSSKKYSGIFDGNRKTLTYNITGSDHCAPFAYVSGATIKNLNTAGIISVTGPNAAAIVAEVPQGERLTLENCFSSVTINSTVSGDATHGGLVGAIRFYGDVTITNCAFVGEINGAQTACCSGIVGWSNAITLNITNTYVAAQFQTDTNDCNTFVRNAGALTLNNCYYLNEYNATPSGATQMTAEQFANGEVCTALNNGASIWKQIMGVNAYPVFAGGDIIYGDLNGDCLISALDLSTLRKLLLASETNTNSDANQDGITDIRDLVRLKKTLAGILN